VAHIDKFYTVLSFVRVSLCNACYVMNSKSINMSFFCCSCRFLLYHETLNIIDAMFGEWAITQLYRPNVNLSAGKINTSECVCFLVVKPMEQSFLRNWWLLSSSRIFSKSLRFEVSLWNLQGLVIVLTLNRKSSVHVLLSLFLRSNFSV